MSIANLGTQQKDFDSITAESIILSGSTPLSIYESVGITGTMSGPFVSPIGTIGLMRIIGKIVIVSMNAFSVTATTPAVMTFSYIFPNKPQSEQNFQIYVINNGSAVLGNCRLSTSGVMTIDVGYNNAFSAGICGYPTFSISYACV